MEPNTFLFIFHGPLLKVYLPIDIKFDDRTVVFSFINKVQSIKYKIYNYKEFDFLDQDNQHITNVGLWIIKNKNICKLFTKHQK